MRRFLTLAACVLFALLFASPAYTQCGALTPLPGQMPGTGPLSIILRQVSPGPPPVWGPTTWGFRISGSNPSEAAAGIFTVAATTGGRAFGVTQGIVYGKLTHNLGGTVGPINSAFSGTFVVNPDCKGGSISIESTLGNSTPLPFGSGGQFVEFRFTLSSSNTVMNLSVNDPLNQGAGRLTGDARKLTNQTYDQSGQPICSPAFTLLPGQMPGTGPLTALPPSNWSASFSTPLLFAVSTGTNGRSTATQGFVTGTTLNPTYVFNGNYVIDSDCTGGSISLGLPWSVIGFSELRFYFAGARDRMYLVNADNMGKVVSGTASKM